MKNDSPADANRQSSIAPWVWALPFVLMAVCAPLWLHRWEPTQFLYLNALFAPIAAHVWTGLSLLGNAWGLLALTSPLLVLAPRLMWGWLCAAPFAIVFARTGKFFIESPRPAAVVDNAQMRVLGELMHNVSMPSGHTLTAFAAASGLYFALPRATRLRHGWLWVLAMAAGLSRIAVGAHWPGDVAVGASLGILAGLLGNRLLARMPVSTCQPTHWGLRMVAVMVALSVYALLTEELDFFAENRPLQVVLAGVAVVSLAAFARRNAKALKAS